MVSQSLSCLSSVQRCVHREEQHTVRSPTVQSLIRWNEASKETLKILQFSQRDDQKRLADKGLFIRHTFSLSSGYHLPRLKGCCFCCKRWRRYFFGHLCKVSLFLDNWSDQWQAVWLREDRSLLLMMAAAQRRSGGGGGEGRKQSCILSCVTLWQRAQTEISIYDYKRGELIQCKKKNNNCVKAVRPLKKLKKVKRVIWPLYCMS